MDSRRKFIGKVASGLAGAMAVPSSVLGANDRVRMGIIGVGARGSELVRQAIERPDVEFVAFADVFTRRLDEAKQIVPNAATYLDHRRLLDDNSIDAVIIATPQHLHCEHFVNALSAGKHVYQEKTMAFTVDHAKRMRAAFRRDGGKHVVQVGHQACSSGQMTDALAMLRGGKGSDGGPLVGRITAIHGHMYRNTPHGKPQWSRRIDPDMNPENILWNSFLGEAPNVPFDPNRYINWRFFWDYSGGNVYENMCHQIAFWYKALDLQIPTRVTMTGGLYLWKDGREVPDTMNVALEHPEELLFSWDSGFGNNALGSTEDVLGTDGTISKGAQIRYRPQKVNLPQGAEIAGQTVASPRAHMDNFIESIRGSAAPNCPFEIGYRVSIACRMAVESYRHGRSVTWDAAREEIA
jgi:predicted dehydrogenase